MKNLFRAILLLLACAHCCVPASFSHSANKPAPRSDQRWQDRQKLINERVAEAGHESKVIFIGDSITQGWEGSGKAVWERYYKHRNALNLGIGGDRTQHVLWRLENGNLKGIKPKAAVVMIGTNNSNSEDNSPLQIVEGVTAIVQKLRSQLPEMKILLVAIFPRGENFSVQRGKLAMINQALRKAADNRDIFWIDFGHRFLNSDGTIPADLMPDYLHLSEEGYRIWAQAIERRLATIIGDERVTVETVSSVSFAGEWTWTMETPNGATSAALILKQDGNRITGRFARSEDRWLEIENGKVNGNAFTWTVKRDRPDGGVMVYEMSGELAGDSIKAIAKTDFDGADATQEWEATRK